MTTEPLIGVLHPWCTDFEWQRAEHELRRLTPEQRDQFDNGGWLVVDDVVVATWSKNMARSFSCPSCRLAMVLR